MAKKIKALPTGSRPIIPPVRHQVANVMYGAFKWHEPITPDPLLGLGVICMIIYVDFFNKKKIGHVS